MKEDNQICFAIGPIGRYEPSSPSTKWTVHWILCRFKPIPSTAENHLSILAFAEKCAKRYPKYFPHFNLGIYEKSKFKIIFMKCTAKKLRSSTASKALREVADILFDLRQKKHLAAEGVFVKEHPPFGGIDSSKRKNNQTWTLSRKKFII